MRHWNFRARPVCAAAAMAVVLMAIAGVQSAQASQPAGCSYRNYHDLIDQNGPVGVWGPNVTSIPYVVIASSFPSTNGKTGTAYNATRIRNRIISGANTWSRVRTDCDVQLANRPRLGYTYAGSSGSSATNHNDAINTIDFRDSPQDANPSNCAVPAGYIALGCTYTRHTDGNIDEMDISLAKSVSYWTGTRPLSAASYNAFDLWTLAAHELGHGLGLGHVDKSSDDPSTLAKLRQQVMYFSQAQKASNDPGTQRRALSGSDINGFCRKYRC